MMSITVVEPWPGPRRIEDEKGRGDEVVHDQRAADRLAAAGDPHGALQGAGEGRGRQTREAQDGEEGSEEEGGGVMGILRHKQARFEMRNKGGTPYSSTKLSIIRNFVDRSVANDIFDGAAGQQYFPLGAQSLPDADRIVKNVEHWSSRVRLIFDSECKTTSSIVEQRSDVCGVVAKELVLDSFVQSTTGDCRSEAASPGDRVVFRAYCSIQEFLQGELIFREPPQRRLITLLTRCVCRCSDLPARICIGNEGRKQRDGRCNERLPRLQSCESSVKARSNNQPNNERDRDHHDQPAAGVRHAIARHGPQHCRRDAILSSAAV
jgi:hypothetical protein